MTAPLGSGPLGSGPLESGPVGVGFVGAGGVVRSIHLPTLAHLTDVLRPVALADTTGRGAGLAAREGIRAHASLADLFADPEVEVAVVATPHELHAEHVIAACRAGVRAVLCEKPLLTSVSDAERVAAASRETGVPVVVGAMHTHDPGWVAATESWGELPARVHAVRSDIVLSSNDRMQAWATELPPREVGGAVPDLTDPEVRAAQVHAAVLGVASHVLPLVRTFLGGLDEVVAASLPEPFGYRLTLRGGGRTAELLGYMHDAAHDVWTLDAYADDTWLHSSFTPSFVHAGSAETTLHTADGARTLGPVAENGYVRQWREVAELARGARARPRYDIATVVADAVFTVEVAEAAADLVRKGER